MGREHDELLDEMLHDFYVNNNQAARMAWLDYHVDHGLGMWLGADNPVVSTTTRLWYSRGRSTVMIRPVARVVFRGKRAKKIGERQFSWLTCRAERCKVANHLPPYLLSCDLDLKFTSVRAANAWLSRTAILWAYFTARPRKRPKE